MFLRKNFKKFLMKYVLVILSLLFPIMINAQTREIEIFVDDFYRIYFKQNQVLPTSDSDSSIDFWAKAISEKQILNEFTVCLEVYNCDFELKSNPRIAEERSNYILSRFENDYQINRNNFTISFHVDKFCDENQSLISADIVLLKK